MGDQSVDVRRLVLVVMRSCRDCLTYPEQRATMALSAVEAGMFTTHLMESSTRRIIAKYLESPLLVHSFARLCQTRKGSSF